MTYQFKTIDIKGKQYVSVNERIKYFWSQYPAPKGRVITEMKSNADGMCHFEARIYIDDVLVATGNAHEKEKGSYINQTSYIENCETSAVGRALGMLGIGVDTSIATAEEVEIAIAGQETKPSSWDMAFQEVLAAQKARFKTSEERKAWFDKRKLKTAVKEMTESELSILLDALTADENI